MRDPEECLEWAKRYYKKNGHLRPKPHEKFEGHDIYAWLSLQRHHFRIGEISVYRSCELEKMGVEFDENGDRESQWLKGYSYAKKYYDEHGNIDIPYGHKVEDGYNLGVWVNTQKRVYNKVLPGNLTKGKIKLLEDIGIKWRTRTSLKWDEWYDLAKKYYNENKNLEVPMKYVTEDGYRLGQWIVNQRIAKKRKNGRKITEKQVQKLNNIEMIWDRRKNPKIKEGKR